VFRAAATKYDDDDDDNVAIPEAIVRNKKFHYLLIYFSVAICSLSLTRLLSLSYAKKKHFSRASGNFPYFQWNILGIFQLAHDPSFRISR
jgi:hypothetical protein